MRNALLRFVVLLASVWIFAQQPPRAPVLAAASSTTSSQQSPSAGKVWAELMEGNQRFVSGKPKARQLIEVRNKLASGQHPNVAVLACSDSRVAPELIFDQNLGDLFVVRSAGNVADAIAIGSLEYAVEHLGSSVLVVLGHTKCGAVTAACSEEKMPTPNLQAIMEKIEPAVLQVKSSNSKEEDMVEAAIKENVLLSAKNILASSEVLRHFLEEGRLTVIEAEYQLDSGKVVRLNGKP